MAGRFGGLSSRPQTCGQLQAPGQELGLTALPPLPRDPDSTYCDLPQPSQGDGDGVGGAEASMDVFQLQGLAAPSAMVSGAGLRGGRGAGGECGPRHPGRPRHREAAPGVQLPPWDCQGGSVAELEMRRLAQPSLWAGLASGGPRCLHGGLCPRSLLPGAASLLGSPPLVGRGPGPTAPPPRGGPLPAYPPAGLRAIGLSVVMCPPLSTPCL